MLPLENLEFYPYNWKAIRYTFYHMYLFMLFSFFFNDYGSELMFLHLSGSICFVLILLLRLLHLIEASPVVKERFTVV